MADFRANPAKSCLRQLAKYLNFSGALFIEETSWLPRKLPSTFLSQEGPFSLVPIDVYNTVANLIKLLWSLITTLESYLTWNYPILRP